MIISHKYKFIFLKTIKTAGTSIEIALSKFLGPNDIITPISPEDEKKRRDLGYRGAQHYLAPLKDYKLQDVTKLITKGRRKSRFYNHIAAKHIRENIEDEVWNDYFKFCFERNPWDRVVSFYYWRCRSGKSPTITEFLESSTIQKLKRRGIGIYTLNGQIAVDKVCQYSALDKELEAIRNQLGIPEKLVLPHAKSGFRKDRRGYRELLNTSDKEKIAKLFSDEISNFNYKF